MDNRVTSPVDFFGYQPGADRKIARWDKIVEYFYKLESESEKLKVVNMGPSTEGNPFLAVFISAPQNIIKLDHYREVNKKITNPRGIEEKDIKQLVAEGKAIIVQSMSLHASEIGGTQMAPELAYDLISKSDDETSRILENVIFIMVPCFNPDGQLMVADWYEKWLGTKYEGCSLPWLYHKYAGHDNNRDAFALNLVESQYMAQLLFKEWFPHAFQDHHHMGSYGARFYIAPYCDPIRPYADPLVWRELSWYGSHMAYKLEEQGVSGVLNDAQYPAWGHFGFHWMTNHHNIAGMLTESASANLATPKYIEPKLLTGTNGKSFPKYEAQTNFPNPWKGGWWHLSDIVNQQKISSWSLLDIAARNRETVLWNAYQKAVRQTGRGANDEEYAYLIPAEQHDNLTVRKLIKLLLNQGIQVEIATTPVQVGAAKYPQGSYLVPLAQPKMGVIKNLLSRTLYPDNFFTSRINGESMAYDTAADTVAEYMGVEAIPLGNKFDGDFAVIHTLPDVAVRVDQGQLFAFDGRLNDSYKAANLLMAQKCPVSRSHSEMVVDGSIWPPGTFVATASQSTVAKVAEDTGVSFIGISKEQQCSAMTDIKPLRIGLFQRYWGGNADEGWSKLVLENFAFNYITIMDKDILSGNLHEKIDVLIIPSDEEAIFTDIKKATEGRAKMILQWFGDTVPPEYHSGVGKKGLQELCSFVENGGRLVTLNNSCNIAIEAFQLKVDNIVKNKSSKEYLTHGSTLWVNLDSSHDLCYGMPDKALVFNWDSPVLRVEDRFRAEQYQVFMRYAENNILQSGQLRGESLIAGQAAGIKVKRGAGDIILLAVPPQYRAQLHGTFKLLFNTLY